MWDGKPTPATAPSRDEVSQAFGPDGVIASMYEGYEARSSQVEMAEEVRSALESKTLRSIEAGTGVGGNRWPISCRLPSMRRKTMSRVVLPLSRTHLRIQTCLS